MSTRSKSAQSASKATENQVKEPTPSNSNVKNGESPKTARLTRLEEKNTLIGLNNRLAAIIERNQQLEFENSQLTLQIETAEETLKISTKTISETIGKENGELRKQLLDSENEKAKVRIELDNSRKQLSDTSKKLQTATNDAAELKKLNESLKQELASKKLEAETCHAKNLQLQSEKKELENDLKKSNDEMVLLKRKTDPLPLQIIQLQNTLKSIQSDFTSKTEMHRSEIQSMKVLHAKKIEEVGENMGKEHAINLEKTIQALRSECELQIGRTKSELESLFKLKEGDFAKERDKLNIALRSKTTEFLGVQKLLQETKSRITFLEKDKDSLTQRVQELTESLSNERKEGAERVKELEKQLADLAEEKNRVITEYQDLMEIKVALANEIATYRSLLEGEEERLNLSNSFSSETGKNSRKRQRTSK